MQPPTHETQPAANEKRRSSPGAMSVVVLLGLLAAVALIISNNVFVIRTIEVEGNQLVDTAAVIDLSGIPIGSSMFSLNTSKIRDAINNDRYLEYVGIWRRFPDHVILTVKEDTPRAQIDWMGTLVLIGKDGVVLEQTSHIDIEIDVPMLTGKDVVDVRVGQPLVFAKLGQLEAMNSILDELTHQNLSGEISELNVATLDNLYLVTSDGLQVMLGNSSSLPMKMAQMRAFLADARAKQTMISGGVLDVTTGKFADFRPPLHP